MHACRACIYAGLFARSFFDDVTAFADIEPHLLVMEFLSKGDLQVCSDNVAPPFYHQNMLEDPDG